jgi:hypothetical protein
MKSSYIKLLGGAACLGLAMSLTSCLDETFPNSSTALDSQVASDLGAIANGMPAYFNSYSTSSSYDYGDCGWPCLMMNRDAMLADMPVYKIGYDYFMYFAEQDYLGDWLLQTVIWYRYYYLIRKADLVLSAASSAGEDSSNDEYIGDAYNFRAMAYEELAATYEYRKTNTSLDDWATTNNIWDLTVPIVTDKTGEDEARNNPRAPFYKMYRFIMNDLNRAEEYLADVTSASAGKTHTCLGVTYGLKARLWLTLATRFQNHADDLAKQVAAEADYEEYDKLGITSALECYQNAQKYARMAINQGFSPLTKSQWFDPKTGFNTPNQSWMWCISISSSDPLASLEWRSFMSYISPEALWGVASYTYEAYRLIDANLYKSIQSDDWRKNTWIAPGDAANETAYNSKYASGTNLDFSTWSKYVDYAGFKFHPAAGETENSATGIAVSIPLMRVEEMYFIEMEAKIFTEGVTAGVAALNDFMNTYRTDNAGYSCKETEINTAIEEMFNQKRIEFWGEGIVYFDYRRLEHSIKRKYDGTNHQELYQWNSYDGYTAPYTIYYIPESEHNLNPGCALNPDPSNALPSEL